MATIPAPGVTWAVTLQCQGSVQGPFFGGFLEGLTEDGSVDLAHTTDLPATGTLWAMSGIAHGIVILTCLGNNPGPRFRGDVPGPRFLDGRTQEGTVGMAATTGPPFTGTKWQVIQDFPGASDGTVIMKCIGDIEGSRFLDGRTQDGSVGLAPVTTGVFTGTNWKVHKLGELVFLQCQGQIDGPFFQGFLDGRTNSATVGLAPTTADPFTGALWVMDDQSGIVTLKSLGSLDGPRFLDGRTQDGSIGLADNPNPPFTGTRWQRIDVGPRTMELRCLGTVPGPFSQGFLDGRTQDGSVGLALSTNPPFTGTRWSLMCPSVVLGNVTPVDDDIVAIHAALLPTSEVVYFGGDEFSEAENKAHDVNHTRLFDCNTGKDRRIGSPATDVFCCGHAILADGRLLVAGGTEDFAIDPKSTDPHAGHFTGLHECWTFSSSSEAWTKVASLTSNGVLAASGFVAGKGPPGGRWYPMLVTIGTGDVLAMSGHPCNGDIRHNSHLPERYSTSPAPFGTWRLLGTPDPQFEILGEPKLYPRLHMLPNGLVFCSTPLGSVSQSQLIDPSNGARHGAGQAPPDPINVGTFFSQDGTSVLLPLLPSTSYRPQVLLCGGTQTVLMDLQPLLDDPNARGVWTPTSPRHLKEAPPRLPSANPQRFHLNSVLLPTGDVMICGGCSVFRKDFNAVLESELYHPSLDGSPDAWQTLPAGRVVRNYHSVALLMPDGRVWTAGSTHDGGFGHANAEPRIEILNPPYIGADRPALGPIPATITLRQTFIVDVIAAKSIIRVAILRAASVTHSFSSDQRYVGLEFEASDSQLTITAPPDHNIAPPGPYLMFVIDNQGLPSEGRFVLLV
jgi:Domain of unknown function (DUF1929)